MSDPTIADTKPCQCALEVGKHAWCACGKSQSQPFCDGSHKGTEFRPLVFDVTEAETKFLCMCKHTKNPPFCDGSHKACRDQA